MQKPDERAVWQSRYAAYALASEADTEQVNKARAAVDTGTYMFSPETGAGFDDANMVFAGFT